MNAIGHRANGDLLLGPSGKERLEDVAAHLPVQFAHAVDLAAATYSKIGHVKGFQTIAGILSSHGEQIIQGNAEFILRVMAQILTHELWLETIEACSHRRMGSKQIS